MSRNSEEALKNEAKQWIKNAERESKLWANFSGYFYSSRLSSMISNNKPSILSRIIQNILK
jgi:hypothetical protein